MNEIKKEADKIFNNGLYYILNNYGNPFINGSYYLDLMTWRDLDIYIDVVEEENFFRLSYELACYLQPYKMNYRNEIKSNRSEKPSGLYIGIYTVLMNNEWKIDLWGFNENQIMSYKDDLDIIKRKVSQDNNKKIIIDIKKELCQHPYYRKQFTSVDIYNSVLNNNISSIEEFKKWLMTNKNIIIE